jgi:hypothetical protein
VRGGWKRIYKTYDLIKESQTFVKNLSWIHVQGMKKEAWRIAASSMVVNFMLFIEYNNLAYFSYNFLIHFLFI